MSVNLIIGIVTGHFLVLRITVCFVSFLDTYLTLLLDLSFIVPAVLKGEGVLLFLPSLTFS